MDVKVYINKNFTEYWFSNIVKKEDLELSATIKTNAEDVNNALEDAFSLGQNVTSSWVENPQVESDKENLRSVSVGDVLEVNNNKYVVQNIGFKKIIL